VQPKRKPTPARPETIAVHRSIIHFEIMPLAHLSHIRTGSPEIRRKGTATDARGNSRVSVNYSSFSSEYPESRWSLGGALGGAIGGAFRGAVKPPHPADVKCLARADFLRSGNPRIMPPQECRDMIRRPDTQHVPGSRTTPITPCRFIRYSISFGFFFEIFHPPPFL
jgi:hypothetical protein